VQRHRGAPAFRPLRPAGRGQALPPAGGAPGRIRPALHPPHGMARIAEEQFRMAVRDVPGPPIRIPIWLVWHEGRRRDAGHAWLRRLVAREIRAAAAETGLLAAEPAAAK
jgi:DNA-binding transcriptional LysR family regulator